MSDMEPRPLSDILAKAGEPPDQFKPLHLRKDSDNVKRIAEFITKLTWREITSIALAVEEIYRGGKDVTSGEADLAEAMVVWAEKLLGESS